MNKMIARASADQAKASDPAASVFVSANAGTGKTKLLTDRVLRLLLSGAPADAILCVTYTRAAAAEMRNRIFKRLADWAIIPAKALGEDLENMGIHTPSQDMRRRARSLFAEILDNDDGPRVETVHSFCQSILRRFPIEAGVAPHVQLADDDEQSRLKAMARANILYHPSPELAASVLLIAEAVSEGRADEIVNDFINRAVGLDSPDCLARIESHFRDDLGVVSADTERDMLMARLDLIQVEKLRAVSVALQTSKSKIQIDRGAKMAVWLAQTGEGRIEKLSFLVDALFSAGKPRKQLSNADIRKTSPQIDAIQKQAIETIKPLLPDRAAQICRDRTMALYRFGMAFNQEYSRLKTQRGLLDYNDLITRTNNLLAASEAAQWVAWKLDNGIQHLLIDEAQDTSPAQWKLLRRLVDEFFDGEGASPHRASTATSLPRTMFAVGDFKQSIYSFQGADPLVMNQNRSELSGRAKAIQADFRDVPLSVSFRSASPILDLVNKTIPDLGGIDDFTTHEMARSGAGGFVELWPVVKGNDDFGAEMLAATQLARRVKSWIGKRHLPSGDLVGAGDILILLRKRGRFFELLLSALQIANVQVAGADRMQLAEQIEIQDLLALGDVMHLADDDLQLAAVLKSPLFGMSEDQLYDLAYNRGKASLMSRLMAHRGADGALGKMADQLARWQSRAEYESVFGFFSFVLVDGGRQKFRDRLGRAVDESLDHFLNLAQNFALGGGVSLLEFLTAIRSSGGEVKRDIDASGTDEVRIMTIHGAKGLEAPIVILPDMLASRGKSEPVLPAADGSVHYWLPPSDLARPAFVDEARQAATTLRTEEDNRLLYVAMTRARDGLVIGGWEKPNGVRRLDGSDYALLSAAIKATKTAIENEDGTVSITAEQTAKIDDKREKEPKLPPKKPVDDAADWLFRPAPMDDKSGRPIRPSQPGLDHDPQSLAAGVAKQNAQSRQIGLAYGKLAHRLLEQLPATDAAVRRDRAVQIAGQSRDVPDAMAASLIDKLLTLIDLPAFAPLFSKDALVEVPINGRLNGIGIAGQIDRLFIDDKRIILADFKTGQPRENAIPRSYLHQMALYDGLLQKIYPGRDIECWLVWVDTLDYQPIGRDAREQALADIFAAHDPLRPS
ncbi:MAG: double-strand break repair helicase AddA [Alphaproteobacteria bacterium]|nr:double-strand break repair helicase AddA [Alphaproteobacteria bacterium]